MNKDRDKYLTEAMGNIYHDFEYGDGFWRCNTCEIERVEGHPALVYHQSPDFSSWEGFGKLWNFVEKQPWLEDFEVLKCGGTVGMYSWVCMNPDYFANRVFEYLKYYKGER